MQDNLIFNFQEVSEQFQNDRNIFDIEHHLQSINEPKIQAKRDRQFKRKRKRLSNNQEPADQISNTQVQQPEFEIQGDKPNNLQNEVVFDYNHELYGTYIRNGKIKKMTDKDQDTLQYNHIQNKTEQQQMVKEPIRKQYEEQLITETAKKRGEYKQKEEQIIIPEGAQHQDINNILITESQLNASILPAFVLKQKKLESQCLFQVERILFFPQKFHLYLNQKHLLTARRKIVHSTSLYYFFSDKQNLSTQGMYYVGYMQSNLTHTQYRIFTYDNINLAYITYQIQQKKPPQILVYIRKNINQHYRNSIIVPQNFQNILLRNKKPNFNPITQKYNLNFMGRAKEASIKNCILEDNEVKLILGKRQEKHYNLDFGYPFSQITAFGFAISNYQQKFPQ